MSAKFNANKIQKPDATVESEVTRAVKQGQDRKHRQGVASPEEQRDRANKMQTSGRRGCKAPRINLSTTPDNYDFIRVLAKASGRSMTRTVNDIITLYREKHQDYYDDAKKFLENNDFWEGESWES